MQHLTLIRGAPGSGKSTLAKTLSAMHVEADMFFIQEHGKYVYQAKLIKQAHEWCQEKTQQLLEEGNDVVVANTFIKIWEMQFYLDLAKTLKVNLHIMEAKGCYQNIHGVPADKVAQMRKELEPLQI